MKNYIKPYLEDENIEIEDIMIKSITDNDEATIDDFIEGDDIGGEA